MKIPKNPSAARAFADAMNCAPPELTRAAGMVAEARAERDAARRERDELREAVQALLKGMCEAFDPFYEDVFGREILGCSICGERIATGAFAGIPSCDECAKERGGSVQMTRRFTPALRRLRALVEVSRG